MGDDVKLCELIKENVTKGFLKEFLEPGAKPITEITNFSTVSALHDRKFSVTLDGTFELQRMVKDLTQAAMKKDIVKTLMDGSGVSEEEAFYMMLMSIKSSHQDPVKAFLYLAFYKDNWNDILETAKVGMADSSGTIVKKFEVETGVQVPVEDDDNAILEDLELDDQPVVQTKKKQTTFH